jgi:hypothetical protein
MPKHRVRKADEAQGEKAHEDANILEPKPYFVNKIAFVYSKLCDLLCNIRTSHPSLKGRFFSIAHYNYITAIREKYSVLRNFQVSRTCFTLLGNFEISELLVLNKLFLFSRRPLCFA